MMSTLGSWNGFQTEPFGVSGMDDSLNSDALLDRLRAAVKDGQAWEEIARSFGPRLRAMVEFRMHDRLRGRIDPSDVLQETYCDAARRLAEYLNHPQVPFYIWLRSLAAQRLVSLHRRHLGAEARSVHREVPLYSQDVAATSAAIAKNLVGNLTSPSSAAVLAELRLNLESALNDLSDVDREILVLRHFEEMTNGEAAAVLGLSPAAASNRYVRALGRIKDVLARFSGGSEEFKK
jgi:RNA polymerase sigma-70 factor, ECF subfamily